MKFKWSYNELGDRSIYEQIRENRKISDSFIYSQFEDLPPITLLKDIQKAADRIIEAVRNHQKIMIYGHDDVDGVTATYILFDFLEKIGSQNHFYYIPNRLLENHGIPLSLVQRLIQDDFELLITVDGGISEFSKVENLKDLGIDVIITDHHIVQDEIPDALAVVNPKQKDCEYPDKMPAGVAISYFLTRMIAEKLSVQTDENYLFWVAVGTIADRVPLVGVNRILVKEVMDKWFLYNDSSLETLRPYFVVASSYDKRMAILKFIGRLLSNGRQAFGEHLSLYFLLAPLSEKEQILKKLVQEQRRYENKVNLVCDFLDENIKIENENSIIFFDQDDKIDVNLLGFAASKLSSRYKIPTVMLKKRNKVITGEARATKGFCLISAFEYCRNLLIQFGGHSRAAGFTAKPQNIEEFKFRFQEYANNHEEEIRSFKKLSVDAVFSVDELDKFYTYLQTDHHLLQPFGQGNRNPTFMVKNYCPERDWPKIKLKDTVNVLDLNKTYDVLFKFKGSSFRMVDFRELEQ